MKTLLTILLVGITMSTFAQIKVNHIAVHVSNLNSSKEFYQKIVGLEEIEEPFKDNLHAWYDIGGGAALHIIEAANVPTQISKVNHLCFSMKDMDSFIKTLENTDYPYESWVGEKGKITVRVDGIRQIYIQDPDGMWLEINDDY
ncbi:catechol 2,3-dioxygenase-like lactoylglutathione lyase family enzyme [Algoriphagus ratkowskyi]|uniref:Catechol 2,3-dioxygenase-like lactoylglutathione lyase family enzyme n=2 Tax=Algoriphagus ratkowskyi TaxID=57028 RepID=A0A2W7QQ11_9BACT|nr:VOC family protein [Algoriphagus ratkowskyi]PZX50091.1 catechol 2,3-dioxygenase-like lactoylglutathione lyase family enzyme [Algoriphagus ratkowskyi]